MGSLLNIFVGATKSSTVLLAGVACGPGAPVCVVAASAGYDGVHTLVTGEKKGLMRLGASDSNFSENLDLVAGEVISAVGAAAAAKVSKGSVLPKCKRSPALQVCQNHFL